MSHDEADMHAAGTFGASTRTRPERLGGESERREVWQLGLGNVKQQQNKIKASICVIHRDRERERERERTKLWHSWTKCVRTILLNQSHVLICNFR